ncbi:hypothetical protein [Bradyrhizobium sp. BR 1432]|uniref:hypothetical protein n=1 Tax=Bradyrhizobium sp. BR 1432 TaxID=3447966 RepID=UPI003EE4B5E2
MSREHGSGSAIGLAGDSGDLINLPTTETKLFWRYQRPCTPRLQSIRLKDKLTGELNGVRCGIVYGMDRHTAALSQRLALLCNSTIVRERLQHKLMLEPPENAIVGRQKIF